MPLEPRAWLAEFIATFVLVLFGPLSVSVTVLLFDFQSPTASILLIGLTHGLAITLMVYAVGHISGAHVNPAVTIPLLALRKISVANGIGYIALQLLGGVVAAAVHAAILPQARGAPVFLGLNQPGAAIGQSETGAFGVEVLLTFFLVFVIMGVAIHPKAPAGWAGFAIGMTVALDHFVGLPLSGASMNPARTFGPALLTGNFTAHWVYWAGPVVGGLLGALVYRYVLTKRDERA
jgi:aquaporin-4